MERADATVEKSSKVCGSRVVVEVLLGADGRITALGQEVRACALGQASAALMGAHAVGVNAGELRRAHDALAGYLAGAREDSGDWPGLDVFAAARAYPARHPAILLPFAAVAEATERASARAAA